MIRLNMNTPWTDAPVYFLRRTDSTMEEARRLFLAGCPHGTVVLADFQERGRGRFSDRRWSAQAGKSLLFTVVLKTGAGKQRIGDSLQRLPLLAGLSLALSVERLFGVQARLKWPNDLLVEGRKLAGVLCEALVQGSETGVLIGIGLNCNQRVFPQQLDGRATSLAVLTGRQIHLRETLAQLLRTLAACLEDEQWHGKVVSRLYGLNRAASLHTPAGSAAPPSVQRGTIRGLNADGSLVFQPEGGAGPFAVYGGEIRSNEEQGG